MEPICTINKIIFWSGFFKGFATCSAIAAITLAYKYFKNKSIKIEITERKEPTL